MRVVKENIAWNEQHSAKKTQSAISGYRWCSTNRPQSVAFFLFIYYFLSHSQLIISVNSEQTLGTESYFIPMIIAILVSTVEAISAPIDPTGCC